MGVAPVGGGASAALAPSAASLSPSVTNIQSYAGAQADPNVQAILAHYSQGGMSLSDALSAIQNYSNSQPTAATQATAPTAPAAPAAPTTDPNAIDPQWGMSDADYASLLSAATSAGQTAGAEIQAPSGNYGGGAGSGTYAPSTPIAGSSQATSSPSSPFSEEGAIDSLFTSPETAGLAASSQVMNNPLYAGLFGAGGLQGQAQNNYGLYGSEAGALQGNLNSDRQALMGNDPSYGLTSNDLTAYGQASDNIARTSAATQGSLSQDLADRGLSQGGSNSAIANFAGSLGNQNEQLAQAQTQIATNRIATAANLAQSRTNADLANQSTLLGAQSNAGNLSGSLGQLGESAYGQQVGNNLAGAQNDYNTQAGATSLAYGGQALGQNVSNGTFAQQQIGSLTPAAVGGVGAATGAAAGAVGAAGGAGLLSLLGLL